MHDKKLDSLMKRYKEYFKGMDERDSSTKYNLKKEGNKLSRLKGHHIERLGNNLEDMIKLMQEAKKNDDLGANLEDDFRRIFYEKDRLARLVGEILYDYEGAKVPKSPIFDFRVELASALLGTILDKIQLSLDEEYRKQMQSDIDRIKQWAYIPTKVARRRREEKEEGYHEHIE